MRATQSRLGHCVAIAEGASAQREELQAARARIEELEGEVLRLSQGAQLQQQVEERRMAVVSALTHGLAAAPVLAASDTGAEPGAEVDPWEERSPQGPGASWPRRQRRRASLGDRPREGWLERMRSRRTSGEAIDELHSPQQDGNERGVRVPLHERLSAVKERVRGEVEATQQDAGPEAFVKAMSQLPRPTLQAVDVRQ